MPQYLVATEGGVQVVDAATPAALAQAVADLVKDAKTPPGQPLNPTANGKASVVELVAIADVASGSVPQAFVTGQTNKASLATKGAAALTGNATYLASAAYPAGTALTTTQLTTIVRAQRAQIDLLTKQCNTLIRLALGILDDVSNT